MTDVDVKRALDAHRSLLDASQQMPGEIDLSKEPVGRWVPLVLFARLVHLGEAVHRLVEDGFTDAAEPLTRAMVSAAINIVAIVDSDSDSRALAFLAVVAKILNERLKALVRHGLVSQEAANQINADATASEGKVLDQYAEKGVTPSKIGPGKNWHGLTDKDLFVKMSAEFWYDLYYAPFSDDAHVNAAAIGPEITALRGGAGLEFGPRTADPGIALIASCQVISQALRQLDTQRAWGRQKEIDTLFHSCRKEIEEAVGVPSPSARREEVKAISGEKGPIGVERHPRQ